MKLAVSLKQVFVQLALLLIDIFFNDFISHEPVLTYKKKYFSQFNAIFEDKCCRSHDFCPHWIGSFENKWNLFNWSINVIMHCKCDER